MALPQAAVDHYQEQQRIAAAAAAAAADMWSTVGDEFDLGYGLIAPELFATTIDAQQRAAGSGVAYVPNVLDEQGLDASQFAEIDPARFQGGTPDSRPLETLLGRAPFVARDRMLTGAGTAAALDFTGKWLQRTVLDVVRDADRQAVQGSLATTRVVTTWTRMLNPPSCRFCIMLAGKVYRWNQGFRAHRACDCRHVPTQETIGGDLTTDPYRYFQSLGKGEQDRLFGQNDAQAIRDGGDIYRVSNTRFRGLSDDAVKLNGSRRGWQSRRWDSPSKMTVDAVYASAKGDRALARKLLEENGYITGPQVGGGNLAGNNPGGLFGDLAAGQAGRGGTRAGATAAYRRAIASGVRDPLDPATQTAAERRLQTAYLRKQAVDAGRNPFASGRPLSSAQRQVVERDYARQVARIDDNHDSGQLAELARLLGIRR
jgi:hypothetical protein